VTGAIRVGVGRRPVGRDATLHQARDRRTAGQLSRFAHPHVPFETQT